MEYDDPPAGVAVAERTREFVEAEVRPVEREFLGDGRVPPETIADLRERARECGIYAPQIPEEHGGLGLTLREALPVFEAAGRSLLGPPALRVDAPDEGNMHTLELVGTEEQKDRWLDPLARGQARSAFAMTEPMPGGGADPKALRTTAEKSEVRNASERSGEAAEKEGGEWVIDGHKWWATNGSVADVFLVLARTDPEAHPYEGTSIILVPADADGVEVVRDIPHLEGGLLDVSHAEVTFDGVRVPEANLLGAENAGFAIAQQRLGPARLTHCMRFCGMADRALGIARAYASERSAFGDPLAEKQSVRFRIARREVDLHAARTMVRHAARALESGDARTEVAAAKYFTANAAGQAVDDAVQICGGAGVSRDLPLADFYAHVRQFRIYDGPDEVHLRTIARDAFEDAPEGELALLPRFGE